MAAPLDIGSGWQAVFDPSQSKYYYTKDGATQWEWPADVVIPDDVSAGGWAAAKDPSSGKQYFFKGESTDWSVPKEIVEFMNQKATEGSAPAPAAAAAAAGGAAAPAPAAAAPAPAPAAAIVAAPAPAPAAAASGAGAGGMASKARLMWKRMLEEGTKQAVKTVNFRRERFEKLRRIRAKKAKEEAARAKKEAEEAAAEAEEMREEEERLRKLTIVSMLNLPEPQEVERKNMEEYAEDYCNLNRKGIFGGRTTMAKLLSWKKDNISKPLLQMADSKLDEVAVQLFRNVLGFMGDRSTSKEGGGHAEKILKVLMDSPQELRDECYIQVIKQTTNNPDPNSVLNGWQLLSVLAGSIMPGSDLLPYLRSYMSGAIATETPGKPFQPTAYDYAKFALSRLDRSATMKPRREVPPSMEIESTKQLLPALVRLYMLDGSYEMLPCTSMTTSAELKAMMAEIQGLEPDNSRGFAVFEVHDTEGERCLDEKERVMDAVAAWQRLFDEEKQRDGKKGADSASFRLVFKVKHYFSIKNKPKVDEAAQRLMYTQAVYDVVCDRYPCIDEDVIRLGALQRQAEHPNQTVELKDLGRYIKQSLVESSRAKEYLAELNKEVAKHNEKPPSQCRKEYLDYVKSWAIYGSSFFMVRPKNPAQFDLAVDNCFLAINPRGIMIIDPETKQKKVEWSYAEIPMWGRAPRSVEIHHGNLIKQTKHFFQTDQSAAVNELIGAYVNEMVARVADEDD